MTTNSLPVEARQLGETPQYIFAATRPSIMGLIVIGFLLLFTGCAMTIIQAPAVIAIMLISMVALIGIIVMGRDWIAWFPVRALRLLVYPAGLVYSRGNETNVLRWEDIEAVYENLVQTTLIRRGTRQNLGITSAQYTLTDKNGQIFRFDERLGDLNFDIAKGIIPFSITQLGQLIIMNVTKIKLPRAIQTCQSGDKVNFDAFSISQQGLQSGSDSLAWNEVESISLEYGFVVVKKQKQQSDWLRVASWEVPNLHVMLGLVEQVGKVKLGTG